jgi:hypothetical protein
MRRFTLFAIVVLAASTSASAQTAQGDVSVTIYNNDMALVQDVRSTILPRGESRREFPDVSAAIRPETVMLSGANLTVVEQNFDYDLLSPAALLEKAVGQTITLIRTNPATGVQTTERALVLAVNDGAVLQIGDRIEVLRDDGLPVRVVYDSIPPNLRARPTLSVRLQTSLPGPRQLTLSYLTRGMGWKADYVALFTPGAVNATGEAAGQIDVQGWITLTNSTGTTFANARTLLVAGDVAAVQQGTRFAPRGGRPMGNTPGTETGSRERIGDFYLYPLTARTTIANAQTKQVSFLNANGVPARRGYEFRNTWLARSDEAQNVASVLKFSNAKAQGIGDALPAGTVRVYTRDQRGQAQFVGESAIPHTPGGSSLALKTGEAFDVKVQPVVVSRESNVTSDEWDRAVRWRVTRPDGSTEATQVEVQRSYYRTRMKYVVTNAQPVPVTVDVVQSGLNQYWWARDTRVPEESLPGTQTDADTRSWSVPVPANGRVELDVTFLTRW